MHQPHGTSYEKEPEPLRLQTFDKAPQGLTRAL